MADEGLVALGVVEDPAASRRGARMAGRRQSGRGEVVSRASIKEDGQRNLRPRNENERREDKK